MTTRAVAEMREWDRRRYDGGFDGLHDLADREFTGAVEADGAVCFMLRGRVVGVFSLDDEADHGLRPADIEAFEDATGDAYEAPHPALPLLFTMQATGGEERGRYYTEDTPLEEVHERLSSGFTGYVELSENVLSGDYYSVYHGGRAKHAAFVGQSGRLLEDEEAFERACDEVGIYTVTAVDLDITEIPGAEDRASGVGAGTAGAGAAGAAAGAAAGTGGASGKDESVETADGGATVETAEPDSDADTADTADASLDADIPDSDADTADTADASLDADIPDSGPDPSTEGEDGATPGSPDPHETGTESLTRDAITSIDDTTGGETEGIEGGDGTATDDAVTSTDEDEDDEEVATATGTGAGTEAGTEPPSPADGPADDEEIEAAVTAVESPSTDVDGTSDEEADETGGAADRVHEDGESEASAGEAAEDAAALRSALEAREREVERLEDEVDSLETALQSARDERDDLAARVEDLEGRLRELGSGAAAPETAMTPAEALDGTSVFVRYRSKSEPTLDDLRAGVSRESVVGNLQLERHTEFDASTVAVDGREFDAFLDDTQEYQFTRWLVTDLPLEIRDTGSEKVLGDLYGAIPEIDRVEFGATLADDRTFDLVARNRMGEPLVVAALDDSRESTGEEEMAELVRGASAVAEESGSLAGAIAVTGAFFEPAALATVEDATGGSLLSRDKRESYVKLSRSRGFHLCLAEDRDESFYLSVPEL
ncbi:DUF7527 domain-containing protein [Haloglomus litoreum]|uniref:DUF7527 domain-containing protein n=1 Tax=Haloglomus litoreum TaxID=3034026 RepID=UPI0023E891AA|nr:hypothetical protein [Haloglomus sp. DT116]